MDLKAHRTYKYSNTLCRVCKSSEETPEHVLNCGMENKMDTTIDVLTMEKVDDYTKSELKQMVLRVSSFLEKVAEGE